MLQKYPKARGKKPVVKAIFKSEPDEKGKEFLEYASRILGEGGIDLEFETLG